MNQEDNEEYDSLMERALAQAGQAKRAGEVPVGAVIARGGRIIAAEHNRTITLCDPTAHAEMLAIRAAAGKIGDWRLEDCTLAVTLEPCCMCAGAIVLARLPRLVYGAADAKAGAVDTLYNICGDDRLNHRVEVISGIRAEECGSILTEFFRARRTEANGGARRI